LFPVWREESTRSPVAPPRQRPGRRSPPGRTDHPRNAIRRVLAVSSVLDPVVVKVRVRVDRVRAWKRWPCVGEAALPSRVGLAGAGREAGASVRRPRVTGYLGMRWFPAVRRSRRGAAIPTYARFSRTLFVSGLPTLFLTHGFKTHRRW